MTTAADQAGTRTDAPADTVQETRPVRILVPTLRRNDYWLPPNDTLRASDLGITRHTTDDEMISAAQILRDNLPAGFTENPLDYVRRIRDALRIPRDIADARDWGLDVPENENVAELDPNPAKHLGWWWVYDHSRTETREQREARYLADNRIVDMRGFAAAVCRKYATVKFWKFVSDQARRILNPQDTTLDTLSAASATEQGITVDQARALLLAKARKDILKATPVPQVIAGQSALWPVSATIKYGRDTARLTWWYEFDTITATGRPVGSKTRPKANK
jgi:hypothetical protein